MGKGLKIILITFLVFLPFINAYSQYSLSFDYVMELALDALENGDFDDALHFLNIAQILKPYSEEPLFYINFIKRIKEGLIEDITPKTIPSKPSYKEVPSYRKEKEKKDTIQDSLSFWEKHREKKPTKVIEKEERIKYPLISKKKETALFLGKDKEKTVKDALTFWERSIKKEPFPETDEFKEEVRERPKIIEEAKLVTEPLYRPEKKIISQEIRGRVLYLNDELFALQPKTLIQIRYGESIVIEGKSIKRYLVVTPRVIDVERLNDKRINVIGKNMGSSFLHIWDEGRRWTFNVQVIPKVATSAREEKRMVYEAEPFKFLYTADWRSYHKGRRVGTIERQTLSFDQWVGFVGDTPYGELDGSARFAKFGSTTELTNYTLGITNGRMFNFENFDIRIFDIYRGFSDLSYPGTLLRGIYLQSDAFNRNINYSVVWGKEREGAFGYVTPGVLGERESYIEGIKIRLFPYEETNYAFNFARGSGSGRETFLRDKVYSVEVHHNKNNLHISSEAAYDESSFAGFINSSFKVGNANFRANFRNIEKNFTTITGRPADQGEIGTMLGANLKFSEKAVLSSSLDIYRDRYLFNEGKRRRLNFDWDTSLSLSLSPTSSLYSSLYYINNPGLSFPRRYLNFRNTYSKSYKVLKDRALSTFLGWGFQRSRNPLSVSSDYEASTLFSGFRLQLTDSISYYLNYNYSWLEERLNTQKSSPTSLETGIDYYKKITPSLSSDIRFYFRDEEDTTSTHSFLSGEDSVEGSVRLTYTPTKDVEFFVDGRVRNVWAEAADTEKFVEAELRFGLRSSLDTLFSWSPKGEVGGYVFKDLNGNGKKDDGEPPLEGIKIIVGNKELVTNSNGYFSTKIRAKKVVVMLKPDSLPEGYVLTAPYLSEVDVYHGKESKINFGATTSASVYGIVFYDVNSNGKFDAGEVPVGGVELTLGDRKAFSNPQGRYYFRSLEEGEYNLTFNINTIPIDYLPSVPLKKDIQLSEGINYIYSIPLKSKQ